jgi:hypothetical protein
METLLVVQKGERIVKDNNPTDVALQDEDPIISKDIKDLSYEDDNLRIFDTYSVLDRDEPPQCFFGGCAPKNKDKLYEDSENYEVEKLIAQGVSEPEARRQAKEITKERRKDDELYEHRDALGIEGKGPEFTLTESDVLFKNQSLHAMYEKQQNLMPEEYNTEEHATVLSAFQSLRDGVKQAAHIVHHYNENGKLDIRDVVVLTYDHETNTGQMHILNISQEGKNHRSLESAREAMQTRLGGFKEELKTDRVFLFVREEAPIDPVSLFREKSHAPEIHERTIISLNDYGQEPSREVPIIQPAKEAIPFIRPVFQADNNKENVPFRLPSFLQRLMGRDENGKLIKKEKPTKKKGKTIIVYDNGHKEIQRSKSKEETSSVVSRIEKQKEKADEKKKSITFAQQTGVGVGGALLLLDALTQPILPLTRSEKKEIRKAKWRTEQRTSRGFSIKKERAKRENTRLAPASPNRGESRRVKRLRNKEKLKTIFTLKEKRRKELRKEKKQAVGSKEKRNKEKPGIHAKKLRLITVFEKVSRKIHKEVIGAKRKQERNSIGQKETVRRSILEFTRAWILFMLLRSSSFEKQRHEKKENVLFIRKNNKEEKTIHESSPWILLAIIWYMTMIREQGKVVVLPQKKRKKKKNVRLKTRRHVPKPNSLQVLSRLGVIYAYQTGS